MRRPLRVQKFFALLLLLSAAATLGGLRLLLLLRPAALGGLRLLLLLRPAALGGWRLLLLLRPAGPLLLIGSPSLHSRLLWLIRLLFLTLLLLTLLLLIAACWSLTGRRFTSARSAWRIVTKPTLLTGGERLCWRHISAWLNDVLRFTHRRLSALSSSLSKIL